VTTGTETAALIAFYTTRLDEEEADALKADATVLPPGFPRLTHLVYGLERAGFGLAYQGFAAVHDPASVLADVAADRAILEMYRQSRGAQFPDFDGGFATAAEEALAHRAARFASHPDYRQEWRP
jgi:hypothetical protein